MNKIDCFVKKVNNKYNLCPNSIGSIEHHSEMGCNSIVQLVNKNRGFRTVVSGEDFILINYLQNILDDKIILNFWAIN